MRTAPHNLEEDGGCFLNIWRASLYVMVRMSPSPSPWVGGGLFRSRQSPHAATSISRRLFYELP